MKKCYMTTNGKAYAVFLLKHPPIKSEHCKLFWTLYCFIPMQPFKNCEYSFHSIYSTTIALGVFDIFRPLTKVLGGGGHQKTFFLQISIRFQSAESLVCAWWRLYEKMFKVLFWITIVQMEFIWNGLLVL